MGMARKNGCNRRWQVRHNVRAVRHQDARAGLECCHRRKGCWHIIMVGKIIINPANHQRAPLNGTILQHSNALLAQACFNGRWVKPVIMVPQR